MIACPLRKFSQDGCSYRADGQPDRCHWIPKQRLRDEYRRRRYPDEVIKLAVTDPRILTDGCRRHHDQLDGRNAIRKLELDWRDYPTEVFEYAAEYCWYHAGPRDGWRVDRLRLEFAPLPRLLVALTTPAKVCEDCGKESPNLYGHDALCRECFLEVGA